MATRKKSSKKSTSSKKSKKKKGARKPPAPKRKTVKKVKARKPAPKKAAAAKKSAAKPKRATTAPVLKKRRNQGGEESSLRLSRESSGLQSGDLQGLSNAENVDSESVDELLEEGNAFEAGIVSGVEDSRDRDGKEVRTRQVPEDDVPGEYLDEE